MKCDCGATLGEAATGCSSCGRSFTGQFLPLDAPHSRFLEELSANLNALGLKLGKTLSVVHAGEFFRLRELHTRHNYKLDFISAKALVALEAIAAAGKNLVPGALQLLMGEAARRHQAACHLPPPLNRDSAIGQQLDAIWSSAGPEVQALCHRIASNQRPYRVLLSEDDFFLVQTLGTAMVVLNRFARR